MATVLCCVVNPLTNMDEVKKEKDRCLIGLPCHVDKKKDVPLGQSVCNDNDDVEPSCNILETLL